MVASAGNDRTIRRWDAATGTAIGEPLIGHTGSVLALTAWTDPGGRTTVASAGYDRAIWRWDAATGTAIGEPLIGHTGSVLALTAWTDSEGRTTVASAGYDGAIRRWDAATGTPLGEPLTGHTGSVRALTTWTDPNGHTTLASAGNDGTIRVWDAATGDLLRRVFVEPVGLRGLADRPAVRDLLDRRALTQVLANLLSWRPTVPGGETGPSVVACEGPWGSGKTTIMRLVKERIAVRKASHDTQRHMSVAGACKLLREAGPSDHATSITVPEYQGALTAWFNPWVHQSSDEVWAGLARSIVDAAKPVLFPTEEAAQRYWLARNAERIDRFAVRRQLMLRALSPMLGFSVLIGLATVLINLSKVNDYTLFHLSNWRLTLSAFATVIAAVFLIVGLVHTVLRYYGRASVLLESDLVRGAVLSGPFSEGSADIVKSLRDPTYWLKSGYLHLVQKDTATTIRDLRNAGYDLVVFIDDLDRCSARTTAEVFEAINLFLSGTTDLNAKFVIGLDPSVVAAHLDTSYKDLDDREERLLQYGDDPSLGWAFLRKIVQLPVRVPRASDQAVRRFVATALDVPVDTAYRVVDPIGAESQSQGDKAGAELVESPVSSLDQPDLQSATRRMEHRKGSIERQPEVVGLIGQRLAAQPERSPREAKRLLNVWQLYQRLLDIIAPLRDDEAVVDRACNLVILAEIITRWPSLQPQLHQSCNGQRGLQILASACTDDLEWKNALAVVGLDRDEHVRAVANLRELLRTWNGPRVADLAAQVL
jgi:WD40 repeat protein